MVPEDRISSQLKKIMGQGFELVPGGRISSYLKKYYRTSKNTGQGPELIPEGRTSSYLKKTNYGARSELIPGERISLYSAARKVF